MKRIFTLTVCIFLTFAITLALASCDVVDDVKNKVMEIIGIENPDEEGGEGGEGGSGEGGSGEGGSGEGGSGEGGSGEGGSGEGGSGDGTGGVGGGSGSEEIKHTVTFGGAGNETSLTVNKDGKITEPQAPTKAGYTFSGWYNGDKLWNFETDRVSSDVRLEAKWVVITYTVTYELYGGENNAQNPLFFDVEDGNLVLGAPKRSGYVFAGWYTDSNFGTKVELIETNALSNVKLFARWELDVFEIKYELFGGANSEGNPLTYNVESGKIVLGAPERENHVFVGWFLDEEFTESVSEIDVGTLSDITLYAKWKSFDEFFVYTTDDNGATVTGFDGDVKVLKIPAKLGGVNVVAIGDSAFKDCTGVEEIVIPDTVITIGTSAFEGCSELKKLTIGSGVEVIGEYAFYLCVKIIVIVIPDSVKTIGKSAFEGCTAASSVTVGNGVTEIGESAFAGATCVNKLVIGTSVVTIGKTSFYGCTAIKDIVIPDSVTYIGESAFEGCVGVLTIKIGNGVLTIGNAAFSGCSSVSDLVIGSKVTSIGDKAFYLCIKIIIIVIPDSVTSLGESAFEGCSSATSIKIGNGVKNVGNSAFSGCSSATEVIFGSQITAIGNKAFFGCAKILVIVIPDTVTKIGDSAFEGCSSATSIKIGNGVTQIGNYAFSGCSSSSSVSFGTKVSSIGDYAFFGCIKIIIIIIPDSVRTIGSYAFSGCTSATEIVVGNGVTQIGNSAFEGCTSAEKITLGENVTTLGNRVFFLCIKIVIIIIPESVSNVGENVFGGCSQTTVCTKWETKPDGWSDGWVSDSSAPDEAPTVQTKDEWVIVYDVDIVVALFGDWQTVTAPSCTSYGLMKRESTNIENLTQTKRIDMLEHNYVDKVCSSCGQRISEGLIFKKYSGYANVIGLGDITDTDIVIPATYEGLKVAGIEKEAFAGRSDITSIYIPSSVQSIREGAFKECTGLTEIVIPDSVVSMYANVFQGCVNLRKISIPNTGNGYTVNYNTNSAMLGYYFGTTYYEGTTAVTQKSGTITVTSYIPTGLKTVILTDDAIRGCVLQNCTMVENVIITDGVAAIEGSAFEGCTGLTSIEIPSSVKSIGQKAFAGCTGITSLKIPGTEVNISSHMCDGSGIKTIELGSGATIGSYAFTNNTTLEKIVIGNGGYVGYQSFKGCTALNSVTLGVGLRKIDGEAFMGCTSLESIAIPAGLLTAVGSSAFKQCTQLKSVSISDSIKTLYSSAFYGCTSLESITLPKNLTMIESYVFQNCTALEKVTFTGTSEIMIYDYVFSNCNAVTEVHIPSVESWMNITFRGNTSTPLCSKKASLYTGGELLTDLVIPAGVSQIRGYQFYYCGGIKTVYIPGSVKSISGSSFYFCTGITDVVIENGVETIGEGMLMGCSSVAKLTVPFVGGAKESLLGTTQHPLGYIFGQSSFTGATRTEQKYMYLYNSNLVYASYYCYIPDALTEVTVTGSFVNCGAFAGCKNIKTINIAADTTYIGDYAFQNCTGITSIDIPASLKEIRPYTFNGCTGLTSIELPDGITGVGDHSFYNCSSLQSVIIGDNAQYIGNGAFMRCSALREVVIGNSVKTIGVSAFSTCSALEKITIGSGLELIENDAFYSCSKLKEINLKDVGAWCKVSFANYNSNPLSATAGSIYVNGEQLTEVVVPEGITAIGKYAFYNCKSIEKVTLSAGVLEIGENAFYGCTALTSINLPEGLKTIGERAFYSCTALESLVIPDSVETIGRYALNGCSGLKTLVIGKGVSTVENGMLLGCASLESLTIPFVGATKDEAGPASTAVFGYIFGNRQSMQNSSYVTQYYTETSYLGAYIPNSLKSITVLGGNVYYGAFNNLKNVTSITLPDGISEIQAKVFSDCSALVSVNIPNSVTAIGDYAFYKCQALTAVEIPGGVTTIGKCAFEYCDSLTGATLPSGLKSLGERAFYHCIAITEITVPGGVDTIKKETFYACSKLASVTICEGVKSILDSAFSACALENLSVPESLTYLSDSALDTNYGKLVFTEYEGGYYLGCESNKYVILYKIDASATTVNVHKDTKFIYTEAFLQSKKVTSVTIPYGVISIGSYAFNECESITELVIPDSVIRIGTTRAFSYMRKLEKITLSKNITEIPGGTFTGCSSLKTIEIPMSVSSIASAAFEGCESLASITVANGNEYYKSIGGHLYTMDEKTLVLYAPANTAESFVVPDTVEVIEACAFAYAKYLKNVSATGIVELRNKAFYYATALESVSIMGTFTSVPSYCFAGCSALKSYTFSETATTFDFGAFTGSGLVDIVVPDYVTVLEGRVFERCESAKTITLGLKLKRLENSVFNNCTNVSLIVVKSEAITTVRTSNIDTFGRVGSTCGGCTVVIETTVKSIPGCLFASDNANSYYIPKITSVVIKEGGVFESIGVRTFAYCTSLKSIVLPAGVTINGNAFAGCNNLESIYFLGSEADFASVTVNGGNDYFTAATVYYYSELPPAASGNFWYRDENGNPVVWG